MAREAKALVPSAAAWAARRAAPPILYAEIESSAVRSRDPFLHAGDRWLVRRLAPDCNRIETTATERIAEQRELLSAMGAEVANVHLGSARYALARVQRDLVQRPDAWLRQASKVMAAATRAEFIEWTTASRA